MAFKSPVPAKAVNILAQNGYTLEDAHRLSDAEILAMPNCGSTCLAWIREHQLGTREDLWEALTEIRATLKRVGL